MDIQKESPFAPAVAENPLQKNAPLAPSQELAYRKKCIALKRRLMEVESSNDATRRRISQEKDHVQKMRLMRAILLNHLKTIMETPGKKLTPEQLEQIGVMANGHPAELAGQDVMLDGRPDGEGLLDDSSEESEEEPEPAERPERRRRTNNNYREAIMNTNVPPANPSIYQQPAFPNLVPAAFSSAAPRDPAALTSSFRVASTTPQPGVPVGPPPYYPPQPYPAEYAHSSPLAQSSLNQPLPTEGASGSPPGPPVPSASRPASILLPPQPQRPAPPFAQFTEHMQPQLEADSYPVDQIGIRIQQEWDNLSAENRGLWDKRYEEQMMEYTGAMDDWKRLQKRQQGGSFSEGRNRGVN